MLTKTKTKLTDDVGSCWPPKAHLIRKEDSPVKEGTLALCGAKLMGIDLHGMSVKKLCQKCDEIAKLGT